MARINLWTFRIPGLAERREDIEPNVDYELEKFTAATGHKISFNKEARKKFLDFATDFRSSWKANFRDLNAAIVRMATLSSGGRMTLEVVEEEIQRLQNTWSDAKNTDTLTIPEEILTPEQLAKIDRFDRPQLAEVLRVCCEAPTLSEAGRMLFDVSRTQKKSSNDADRLRKYLARFGLSWEAIKTIPCR